MGQEEELRKLRESKEALLEQLKEARSQALLDGEAMEEGESTSASQEQAPSEPSSRSNSDVGLRSETISRTGKLMGRKRLSFPVRRPVRPQSAPPRRHAESLDLPHDLAGRRTVLASLLKPDLYEARRPARGYLQPDGRTLGSRETAQLPARWQQEPLAPSPPGSLLPAPQEKALA
eukprot:s2064_g7.t1